MARNFLREITTTSNYYRLFSSARIVNNQRRNYSLELSSPMPDIVQPEVPLHQYIWKNLNKWPNRTAIVCGVSGKKYTYDKLLKNTRRFGSSLIKLGLKQGDCIGICLPNIPEFPVAYLGSMEAGLIIHLINSQCTLDEMCRQLKETGANCIVCHPSNLNVVKEAGRNLKKDIKIICTRNIGDLPITTEGVIHFEDLIDDSVKDSSLNYTENDLSRTTLINYTSGVTGKSKGVCLTHNSLTGNLEQILQFSKVIETNGDHQDVIPAIIPFSQSYGHAVLMLSLRMGAQVISLPKLEDTLFLKSIIESDNVLLFLVPRDMDCLVNATTSLNPKYLTCIREIIIGAGSCNRESLKKIRQKTKAIISQTYGMTEMSPIISLAPKDCLNVKRALSPGVLLSNSRCKIVCSETGINQPNYVSGEILLKGPQMMKGYLSDQEKTAATIDSEGWLHTGDIGYYDELGSLHVTNRVEEIIRVNGFEVKPTELEEVIKTCHGVLDAGVLGVPCKRSGETPVAFVRIDPSSRTTEKDIINYVASRIFKYKHLSSVKFVQEMPKSISGKIIRKELKNML